MTIKRRLLMNVIVVLGAMVIVGTVAILGISYIKKNINELTQKSTPYQLKALNQQRTLQAHAANLLGISASKTIEEFGKSSEQVSESLSQVNQSSQDMAKLKGNFFSSEDTTITDLTSSITKITEQKIRAQQQALLAAQSIKAKLNEASGKMRELDGSIRKLQQSTSGTMIKSVDSFMTQNHQVHTLNTVRDGLKDLALYITKIPATSDKRSVASLKDNFDKTIKTIISALKDAKGLDKSTGEITQRLSALDEKVTATRGLSSLQLQYITEEDESLKEKIETMAKEAGYEITYMMPTIEREINNASASLKVNTGGMSKNMAAFTDTDAILAAASTLSLLNASTQTQINGCIYARKLNDFENDVSRISVIFGQVDATAQRLRELLRKGNRTYELRILDTSAGASSAVRREFSGVSEKIRGSIKSTEALESLNSKMKEIVSKQLAESNSEVANASSNQEAAVISVNKVANRTMFMVALVGFLSIAVTLSMGILIGKAIAKPLNKLVASVQSVEANGNFSIGLDIKTDDEIGTTIRAFNSLMTALDSTLGNINKVMEALANNDLSGRVVVDAKGDLQKLKDSINMSISRLASTLAMVRDNTGQVAAASEQAKIAISKVSEGSQNQLDSIRRLASAIHESSTSISEVARNTESASVYSKETSELVRDGQNKMQKMVAAVEQIARNSEKINTITDVIGQIADQTHLLSLNATIEAARAGEHGKGFAVVADEVRNLAEDVSRSVDEITALVEQAVKEAGVGVQTAGDVNAEMENVVRAAMQVDSMLYSIAQAMEEQNATIQEINENVSILNVSAESNAVSADEIASSIKELSSLAEQTRNQVEQFTI